MPNGPPTGVGGPHASRPRPAGAGVVVGQQGRMYQVEYGYVTAPLL
jgi:hypothetical protein